MPTNAQALLNEIDKLQINQVVLWAPPDGPAIGRWAATVQTIYKAKPHFRFTCSSHGRMKPMPTIHMDVEGLARRCARHTVKLWRTKFNGKCWWK
jgi:hypothetical protein